MLQSSLSLRTERVFKHARTDKGTYSRSVRSLTTIKYVSVCRNECDIDKFTLMRDILYCCPW